MQAEKKRTRKEAKDMLSIHTIALQKGKVVVPIDQGMDNRSAVATVQAHLMQYRYMMTEDTCMALAKLDLSYIEEFHNTVIEYLKEMTGGGKGFEPLYKNFPKEVMDKSDCELFWESIVHYWTHGQWSPSAPAMKRPVAFEVCTYTVLTGVTAEGFNKIFTDLVSVNTSLTPTDLEVVKWFVALFGAVGMERIMPEKIPFKENLMTLAAMGLPVPIKTPTDVLRIAVHMSGGDISLPAVPSKYKKAKYYGNVLNVDRELFKFKKFKRSERKYLLGLLEQSNCRADEMVLKDQRWIRLGEILHPGEYEMEYPKAAAAFLAIRRGPKGKKLKKVKSWYGKLAWAFSQSFADGVAYLSTRPGEYMRRMDWMIRTASTKEEDVVIENLLLACEGSSNKVLFECYDHFLKRDKKVTGRSITIKGARKKTTLPDLPPLPAHTIELIHTTIFAGLFAKFAKLPTLGSVWIDENLKKIPVPTNMRSVNFALKPTVRGSRMPFDNPAAKVIRAFVHWDGGTGGTDLDLSASFIRDKRNGQSGLTSYNGVLSYSTSGLKIGLSCHSGDVINQPGPCAEYIDVDIKDAIGQGYKYVVLDLRNFRGGALKQHSAVFGMMERDFPESNKHWLPSTITNAQALEASGTSTMIAILDLETKEYIMVDSDSAATTARGDANAILDIIKHFATPPTFSVYDLLAMHAEARGRIVTIDQPIDTYFKFDDFSTSYEQTAKYML